VLSQLLLYKTLGDTHVVQLFVVPLHYEQGLVHDEHMFPLFLKLPDGQLAKQVLLVKYREPLQEEQEIESKHVEHIV
jgi:hypothetical protein